MKTMRKIFALALAVMMVMSLATTAFAADEGYTITINNKTDGHIYEAYQIFVGDLSNESNPDAEDGTKAVLSNIQWAEGVTYNGAGVDVTVIDAEGNETTTKSTDAADIAEALANNALSVEDLLKDLTFNKEPATSTDEGDAYVITNLTPGYYLVKDKNDSLDGKYDAYTSYILEVVENSTISPKSSKPSVDKEVNDDGVWGETADQELNEVFEFKLTAKLSPDKNYAAYESYKLVFHDTMSEGLTFDEIVSVTVNGTAIDEDAENGYTHTAVADTAGASWTLTINDLTKFDDNLADGCEVVVTYKAHLNENAIIGNPGNPNEVQLEYSNNPNWDGEGEEETGKTPEDIVWVFTYELDVTKVDGNNAEKKLKDAEFVLLNKDQTEVAIVVDGKLTEWVAVPADGKTWPANSVLKSGEDGLFVIKGLDDGTYYLKETKAPEGYNLLTAPIKVVVTATHSETTGGTEATIDSLTITVDDGDATPGNTDTGVVTMNVENKAGTTLPETGGMGTTIFYALGGIMVLAAVVLLVTKRRMNIAG